MMWLFTTSILLSLFDNSYSELEMVEFTLREVLVASMSQVMMKSKSKGISMVQDAGEETMNDTLYGDSLRLQQVLSDFLLISINFTPSGGQVVIAANLTKDQLGESVHLVRLDLRYHLLHNLVVFYEQKHTHTHPHYRLCCFPLNILIL